MYERCVWCVCMFKVWSVLAFRMHIGCTCTDHAQLFQQRAPPPRSWPCRAQCRRDGETMAATWRLVPSTPAQSAMSAISITPGQQVELGRGTPGLNAMTVSRRALLLSCDADGLTLQAQRIGTSPVRLLTPSSATQPGETVDMHQFAFHPLAPGTEICILKERNEWVNLTVAQGDAAGAAALAAQGDADGAAALAASAEPAAAPADWDGTALTPAPPPGPLLADSSATLEAFLRDAFASAQTSAHRPSHVLQRADPSVVYSQFANAAASWVCDICGEQGKPVMFHCTAPECVHDECGPCHEARQRMGQPEGDHFPPRLAFEAHASFEPNPHAAVGSELRSRFDAGRAAVVNGCRSPGGSIHSVGATTRLAFHGTVRNTSRAPLTACHSRSVNPSHGAGLQDASPTTRPARLALPDGEMHERTCARVPCCSGRGGSTRLDSTRLGSTRLDPA